MRGVGFLLGCVIVFLAGLGLLMLQTLTTMDQVERGPRQITCYVDGVQLFQRNSEGAVLHTYNGSLFYKDAATGVDVSIRGYECLTIPLGTSE